jgi:hypothetical protein
VDGTDAQKEPGVGELDGLKEEKWKGVMGGVAEYVLVTLIAYIISFRPSDG